MSVSCRRRRLATCSLPAQRPSAETVKSLATAFGVEGNPVAGSPENGMAWQVGPTDGTAPTLTVSASAPLMSWYSAAWEQSVEAPACMPMTTIPATGTLPDPVVPCPAPTPPVGVPTATEAEQRARQLLVALGVDLGAVQFDARVRQVVRQRRGRAAPPRRGQLAGTLELRIRTLRSAQVRQRDAGQPRDSRPLPAARRRCGVRQVARAAGRRRLGRRHDAAPGRPTPGGDDRHDRPTHRGRLRWISPLLPWPSRRSRPRATRSRSRRRKPCRPSSRRWVDR